MNSQTEDLRYISIIPPLVDMETSIIHAKFWDNGDLGSHVRFGHQIILVKSGYSPLLESKIKSVDEPKTTPNSASLYRGIDGLIAQTDKHLKLIR